MAHDLRGNSHQFVRELIEGQVVQRTRRSYDSKPSRFVDWLKDNYPTWYPTTINNQIRPHHLIQRYLESVNFVLRDFFKLIYTSAGGFLISDNQRIDVLEQFIICVLEQFIIWFYLGENTIEITKKRKKESKIGEDRVESEKR